MRKTLLILAAALLTLVPVVASAAPRGRVVVVSRPYYGGWHGPFWGSYWGAGPVYYARPNTGVIKLDTKVRDAEVFIDGSYAGTTHENKTMHLRPGPYSIEIRMAGKRQYAERVYVITGKTLHLRPML
jgi:hypothetical protein